MSTENIKTSSCRECSVCYTTEKILKTPCEHPICSECLFKMPSTNCPLCRTNMFVNMTATTFGFDLGNGASLEIIIDPEEARRLGLDSTGENVSIVDPRNVDAQNGFLERTENIFSGESFEDSFTPNINRRPLINERRRIKKKSRYSKLKDKYNKFFRLSNKHEKDMEKSFRQYNKYLDLTIKYKNKLHNYRMKKRRQRRVKRRLL